MATENSSELSCEECGNVISQIIDSLKDFVTTVHGMNEYVGLVIAVCLVILPFYIVYSLKNNNTASALASIFSKGGA